jgi:signal transduction histidine kinase
VTDPEVAAPHRLERRAVRILHLEDSLADHALVQRRLTQAAMPFSMLHVDSLSAFKSALESSLFDVILADYSLQGFTALEAWAVFGRWQAGLDQLVHSVPPFILLSGAIGETAAVAAIKLGMSDYVLKADLGKLPHVIGRAIEVRQARLAKDRANAELAASEQRLAAFAEHLQSTIEQERAAIAREIHDDIGGSLAAIQFDLAWIGRHSDDAGTLKHADSATDMLRHAMGASQRIMMNLRPAVLDQGLVAALQWLCADFEKRHGISARFAASMNRTELAKAHQLTAYRTAQEALTNVTKYAQCSEVTVDLSDAGGTLTLDIADNGCGISPEQFDKPRAYGLKGLRERARTVGGWLDVSSREGQGTSIILSIPLEHAANTAEEGSP